MRKLTKHERHILYCLIAEVIKDFDRNTVRYGFCNLLLYGFFTKFNAYNKLEFEKYLPELYNKKPDIIHTGFYWFARNRRGWRKRLELIEQCILETN